MFSLSSGQINSYECIVSGKDSTPAAIETALGGDPWWEALKTLRREEERRTREAQAKKNRAQPVPSNAGGGSSRRQSKKEQKLMGVSLPKEHLDFFKKNMQIGLAHPRSSRNRNGREAEEESESEYEESDSDSDLSDELARLDLDDLEWINNGSPGNGLRRTQTYSTARQTANGRGNGLTRRATGGPTGPKLRRNSAGHGRGARDESSNQSLLARRGSDNTDMASSYGSLSSTPRPGMYHHRNPSTKHPSTIMESSELIESDHDGTLKASDRMKAQMQLREAERRREVRHRSSSSSSRNSLASESSAGEEVNDNNNSSTAMPSGSVDLPFVSFNLLPNKAQYLILK